MATVRQCEVENCGQKYYAKGFCQRHYDAVRNHGRHDAGSSRRHPKMGDDAVSVVVHVLKTAKRNGECLEATSGKKPDGYCRVRVAGKKRYAHRLVYETLVEPVTAHRVVRHKCDNPACVAIDHLESGTVQENVDDMVQRGRKPCGESVSQLKEWQIVWARAAHAAGVSIADIARKLKCSRTNAHGIVYRKSWKHVTDSVEVVANDTEDAA